MRSFIPLAVLSALAPVSLAATLTITNSCPFVVTSTMTNANFAKGSVTKINMPSGATSQVTKLIKQGGDIAHPIQIEWSDTDQLYYDLSLIDGGGFGSIITPLATKAGSCTVLTCPGASQQCVDAYQHPADKETHVCPKGTGLNVVLCPGGKVGRDVVDGGIIARHFTS